MTGNVTVIVCGAPLATRTPDLLRALAVEGWTSIVIGTPAARAWLDPDAVRTVLGAPPQFDFRAPGEPKQGGPPDAVVVCPATFNTLNKAASGAADTYALARLCEALGEGVPVVAVPTVNEKLWGHPAWRRNLALLESAGTVLLDAHTGRPGARPIAAELGGDPGAIFEPSWVTKALRSFSRS
ncbi:flavoprotein [Catenuloplanes sp. NPDC051500]|uniref:flavoprotein n=1 Tax=Catenuloplanes sp. NPDC051500 TaxID=3363959 RepID=UPI0037A83C6D